MFAEESNPSMDRRQFTALLTAVGLSSPAPRFRSKQSGGASSASALAQRVGTEQRQAACSYLPRSSRSIEGKCSRAFEQTFERNGWPPQWRNGIYNFHHYHSTAHEVLGIAAGHGRVVLGCPGGHEMTLNAGDVVVLPTGTGHCALQTSADFLVVGAYPPRQSWDICRSAPSQTERERMRTLSLPGSDPLTGTSGALTRLWQPPIKDSAA